MTFIAIAIKTFLTVLLILVVQFYNCQYSSAQGVAFRMDKFNPPIGININSTSCSLIDEEGFLWLGTHNGLLRYDGSKFREFNHTPNNLTTIGGTILTSLSSYRDTLIIGFRGSGIDFFDKSEQRFHHVNSSIITDLPSDFVKNILVDDDMSIWVTFHQSSVIYRYEMRNGEFRRSLVVDIENSGIYNASLFSHGLLVATNGDGIMYYDAKSNEHEFFNIHNSPISSDIVYKFSVINDSTFWVATARGIEKLKMKNGQMFLSVKINMPLSNSTVSAITTDPYNEELLWVGTAKGLFVYNDKNGAYYRVQDTFNEFRGELIINSLMFDKSNNLWIGTDNGGLYKINVKNKNFNDWPNLNLYEENAAHQSTTSVMEDRKGNVWIGSRSNGLFYLDFEQNKSHNIKGNQLDIDAKKINEIKSIVEFEDGEVMFGTNGAGVYKIVKQNDRISKSKVEIPFLEESLIRHLAIDHNQHLWIATKSFLVKYDKTQKTSKLFTKKDGLSSNRIRHIFFEDQNKVWIGTDEGLNVLDAKTGKIQVFKHDVTDSSTISNNQIRCVFKDSRSRYWIGTRGGLNLFNQDSNTFTTIKEFYQYDVNSFYGIYEHKGTLWMSTNNGIFRFEPESSKIIQFRAEDGLQSNAFEYNNSYQSVSGRIYFGGANGINSFFPQNIVRNDHIPPVYITEVMIDDSLRYINSNNDKNGIELSHKDKDLTFSFSSLDYTYPTKNQYKFKLENYDLSWSEITETNSARYTNLDPGKYTFKVVGSNNHGLWNQEGDQLFITIKAPWWQTNIAVAGLMLMAFLLLVLIYALLVFQKNRANRRLAWKVHEKTSELNDANQKLTKLNEDVKEQNDRLVDSLEEISSQRDDLEDKNQTLLKLKKSLDIANDSLTQANENLEIKVKERTDYLEKANTELDRFVYSASHDLSAPLKSMKGLLHLKEIDEKDNKGNYDKMISDSIIKLESVIQSLLQFSRNTSKIVVEEEIKLKPFIEETFGELKYANPNTNVLLQFQGLDDTKSIKVDAYRLNIVVRNIISNAIKYQDRDKTENLITVKYSESEKDLKIAIKDNGIGIVKDQLNKIFKMFYRGTDQSTGSGLGLYIVNEAILKMKGEIRVESKPKSGSTFTLVLPKLDT